MAYFSRLAIILPVAILFCNTSHAAGTNTPPADNDDSYKLPLFMPKAAQPSGNGKVIFNDSDGDNDEIYSLPKRAAAQPSATPVSPQAQQNYSEQYKQYQEQMKLYNQQMAEYKKQLEAQQKQQAEQPSDNDNSYVLPGQYSQAKRNMKPPAHAAPKARTAPQQQTQPAQQQQQQEAPEPQQAAPASQYNQKYNYSDQYDRAPPSGDKNPVNNSYYWNME